MKKTSNHFDGLSYYNPNLKKKLKKSLWRVFSWLWKRRVRPWPFITIEQHKVQKARTEKGECKVVFINHSTVLLQLNGWNILTDPIWSKRASPLSWVGPQRSVLPGVKFEDLPPIDLVIISHNHYDHMDFPTLKHLFTKFNPTFCIPKGNKFLFEARGIKGKVIEMDWWDELKISPELMLHFVPSQHFSARGFFDHNKSLWGGYVIKSLQKIIYFAGDTGLCTHFEEIRERLGKPDLSILPIGAFKPRWLMKWVHLSPEEAVEAHLILQSKQSLAIHFGTFQLADEEIDTPVVELQIALKKHHLPQSAFWILNPGEEKELN